MATSRISHTALGQSLRRYEGNNSFAKTVAERLREDRHCAQTRGSSYGQRLTRKESRTPRTGLRLMPEVQEVVYREPAYRPSRCWLALTKVASGRE